MAVLQRWKPFRQYICRHLLRADVLHGDGTLLDMLAKEMVLNVDVLRTTVAVWVLTQGDTPLIVREQDGGRVEPVTQTTEEGAPPDCLLHCLSRGHILGLDRRLSRGALSRR